MSANDATVAADVEPPSRFTWTQAWICLLAGILSLLTESSNIQFVNSYVDVAFGPLVALLGFFTLWAPRRRPLSTRITVRLMCLPAILGGIRSGAALALLFVPLPFGAMELTMEQEVQRVVSPDGWMTALVSFRPVGGYSEGNGRVSVDVVPTWCPLIAWRVFYLSDTVKATGKPQQYVHWQGSDRLFVTEQRLTVSMQNSVEFYPPLIVRLATSLVDHGVPLTYPAAEELVALVPDYPGRNPGEYPGQPAQDRRGVQHDPFHAYRSFTVSNPAGSVQSVFAWYRATLSESPWTVTRLSEQHDEESTNPRLRFCIRAERADSSGTPQILYVSVLGRRRGTTFVNVQSPASVNGACTGGYDIESD